MEGEKLKIREIYFESERHGRERKKNTEV